MSDDRKQEGLVLIRNIRENVSLSSLDKITHFIHLDKKLETRQINAQVSGLTLKSAACSSWPVSSAGATSRRWYLPRFWKQTRPY